MSVLANRLSQSDVSGLPDWEAAQILNDPDPNLPGVETFAKTSIGIAAILDQLGPENGAAVLDAIESQAKTSSVVRWGMELIRGSCLDLSRPSGRALISLLVANGAMSEQAAYSLLELSRRTRHPSWSEVYGVTVDARAVGIARGGI